MTEEQSRRKEQGRIRMARKGVDNLSQTALAERISSITGFPISRGVIQLIEAGERDAEVGIVRAVATITGLSREWLLGDRDIPGYLDPWHGTPLTLSDAQGYLDFDLVEALMPVA